MRANHACELSSREGARRRLAHSTPSLLGLLNSYPFSSILFEKTMLIVLPLLSFDLFVSLQIGPLLNCLVNGRYTDEDERSQQETND